MGIVICVASQKGGVGKSTSAANLSACFALFEKKTLLIDCDPMGNATIYTGARQSSGNLFHALNGELTPREILFKSSLPLLDVLPAGIELSLIERKLLFKPQKESVLYTLIRSLIDDYDYIVIDSPPVLGFLTACAIVASDYIVIPMACRLYALEGFEHLLRFIRDTNEASRSKSQSKYRIAGLIFTWCHGFGDICDLFTGKQLKHIQKLIFESTIPPDRRFLDAAGHGKPIVMQDLMSEGASAYLDLAYDVIARCHLHVK